MTEVAPIRASIVGDVSQALSAFTLFENRVDQIIRSLAGKTATLSAAVGASTSGLVRSLATSLPAVAAQGTAAVQKIGAAAKQTERDTAASARSLRGTFAALGAAAAGAFVASAVGAFAEYDRAITAVRAVTKQTESQFASTRAEVLRFASSMAVSAREVALGLNDIVQAGFSTSESFSILSASLKGARAGLTETAIASKALISVLNAFNIPAASAEATMGKLVKAVDIGIFSFEGLASNIGQVASQAAAAGATLDETLSLLTALTRKELNIDEVTTQVKSAIAQLTNPSQELRARFQELLGTTLEVSIANRGVVGTLAELIRATDGSVSALARLFPGIREFGAITKLLGGGIAEVNRDMEILSRSGASSLSQTLNIQRGSVAALFDAFKQLVSVGFTDFFERNRGAIASVTTALITFAKENRALLSSLAGATIVVGGFAAAVGALGLALISFRAVASGLSFLNDIPLFSPVRGAASVLSLKNLTGGVTSLLGSLGGLVGIGGGLRAFLTAFRGDALDASVRMFRLAEGTSRTRVVLGQFGAGLSALLPTFAAATRSVLAFGASFVSVARGGGIAALLASVLGGFKAMTAAAVAATAASAAALAPLAAIAAAATGMFLVGKAIGTWLYGLSASEEKAIALAEKLDAIRDKLSGLNENPGSRERELDALRERTDLTNQFAAAAARASRGERGAAEEAIALSKQLAEAADDRNAAIAGVQARLDALTEKLASARKKIFDEGGVGVDIASAFSFAEGGDAEKGKALTQEFFQLTAAVRGYNAALSAQAGFARAALAAQAGLDAQARLSSALLVDSLSEIERVSEARRAASLSPLEKATEEIDAEVRLLEAVEANLSRQLAALIKVGGSGTQEAKDLEAALAKADAAIRQSLDARRSLIEAEAARRVEAEEDAFAQVERLEADRLQKLGKSYEAEKLLSKSRYDAEVRRINSLRDISLAARAALLAAAKGVYDADLAAADKAEARRVEDAAKEAKRREEQAAAERKDAAEKEAALVRQQILRAVAVGDVRAELALRDKLRSLEAEITDEKQKQVDSDLETLDAARRRLGLLREELAVGEALGKDTADIARGAQRDLLGSSDPVELRGNLRERFEKINDPAVLREVGNAGGRALDAEEAALRDQRQKAARRGDAEEVRRLDQAIREVQAKRQILIEEFRRANDALLAEERRAQAERRKLRAQEIEEERARRGARPVPGGEENRERVEERFRKQGLIGQDETLVGFDQNGKPVAVPTKDVGKPPAAPPSTAPGPVPPAGAPVPPGAPPGSVPPGGTAPQAPGVAALGAASSALDAAGAAFVAAVDAASAATASAMTTFVGKLDSAVQTLNEHAGVILGLETQVRRLAIEGVR